MLKKSLLALMLGASISGVHAADAKQVEALQKQIEDLQKKLVAISKQVQEQGQHVDKIKTDHKHIAQHKAEQAAQHKAEIVEQVTISLAKTSEPPSVFEKGYFAVPGTNTGIKFYGMVKLDTIYDGRQSTGEYSNMANLPYNLQTQSVRSGSVTSPPLTKYSWRKHFGMNAKNTMLGTKAVIKNKSGNDVKVWVEFDFYGSSGQGDTYPTFAGDSSGGGGAAYTYTPRLRHGLITYGGLKAGFTWTNFQFDDVYVQMLDPGGLSLYTRQALIAYKFNAGKFKATVAAEGPRADYVKYSNNSALNSSLNYVYFQRSSAGNIAKPTRPDLTLSARYDFENGSMIGLALLSRDLTIKNNSTSTNTLADGNTYNATGSAANFTVKIMTFGKSSIQASYIFGRGIGWYVSELNGRSAFFSSPQTNATAGSAFYKAIPATALWAGYTQVWNDHWKTNLGGAYFKINASSSMNLPTNTWYDPGLDRSMTRYAVNTIYSPEENLEFGLEYMFLKRTSAKQPTGFSYTGIGNRYMFCATYRF